MIDFLKTVFGVASDKPVNPGVLMKQLSQSTGPYTPQPVTLVAVGYSETIEGNQVVREKRYFDRNKYSK